MLDAALRGEIRAIEEPRRGALWPASLAGALLLHFGGFGALLWLGAPEQTGATAEPMVIELTLERLPAEEPESVPDAPAAAEAPPPEPEPAPPEPVPAPPPPEPPPPELPPPEPPPPEPPPPEAAPPVRPQAVAPPPASAPRPRPPQPPRERRAGRAPSSAATTAAPAPAAPVAPAGPPVVTNARFRRTPTPPDYPLVARERGITGTALIRALVGADGETREVRLHRSSGHDILDSAALAAVRRWAFEPSSRDGRRIESWIEVPIRFQLR